MSAGPTARQLSLAGPTAYPARGRPRSGARSAKLRLDVRQAVRASRVAASVYVSFSEHVGIGLSLLRHRARHVLIAHLLTSAHNRMMQRVTLFLRGTEYAAGMNSVLLERSCGRPVITSETPGLTGFVSDEGRA